MAKSNDTAEKKSDDTPAKNQTDGDTGQGPFLYYVRVFLGFFEPPTHLGKDIFTT